MNKHIVFSSGKRQVRLYRSRAGNFMVFLFLAFFCAFMILPVFYAVVQSFKPLEELFAFPPRFFVRNPTLANYKSVFQIADNLWVPFSRYAFNSFFVAIVGTVLSVIISSLAAYPLAKRKFPGGLLISNIIVWALLFRQEVTVVPQYMVVSALRLVDTYGAVILPTLAGTMGVFLMKQFMISAVPDSTLEAARIDGCSEFGILFKIVFPSVKPGWLTMSIFTFQALWNNAASQQYIYSESLKQLPAALNSISAGGLARTGAASAVAVILMIPPILFFILSQSSVMETMSHSGLK